MALLEVKNLEVRFGLRSGEVHALRDINFTLERGERLGVVGESGAGKSVLGFSILNLLSRPGYIAGGEILFEGRNLAVMSAKELRSIRGNRISMIFQDPMMTLNPVLTIGQQMVECLLAHRKISGRDAKNIALQKLKQVYIPSPEKRFDQYPHELSGGMRQRIVIAIGLLMDPDIIIADEPTTALDVTIQAEIMDLMLELCERNNVALMLITHDLGVVSQVTQQAMVMYAGRIIEQGPTREIINDAQHPYTQGLMNALPQMAIPGQRLNQIRGSMPPLQKIPDGCAFNPRCEYAMEVCQTQLPDYTSSGGCRVACHLVAKMKLEEAAARQIEEAN
ncbi:ABC transporter ATP-binding protein [Marinobacterium sp. D7]|uniref:ABC transporter ATP-binding protein n=1 Tax=Marinobacterium ramblicola TaxID=2849041 RepID=UPI001C2DD32D|nr:ABC transporter ATP-binding protein [Marinobacterium ramblicola]MBV1788533.1 ABC transporter ATP-binding protein [Marinobacterium ramblicola]